jgi:23S rRNA (pseudouridine1915-N3)-methyltransferase
MKVIPALRHVKNLSPEDYKQKEGEMLLPVMKDEKDVFLLDENGREYSSREFAGFIDKKMNTGCRHLIFVIGGPFGFSDDVYKASAGSISLSRLTFSHQLVRLVFAEQLYRACTIMKGEPYHHD